MARLGKSYQAVLRSAVNSKKLSSVSWPAEALYYHILLVTDCSGRMLGDSFTVCTEACRERMRSGDADAEKVECWLVELTKAGLITRWCVAGDTTLEVVGYFDAGYKTGNTLAERPDGVPALVCTGLPRNGTVSTKAPVDLLSTIYDPISEISDPLSTIGKAAAPLAPAGAVPEKPKKLSPAEKLTALIDANTPPGTDLAVIAAVGRACEEWRVYRVKRPSTSPWIDTTWIANLKDAWADPDMFVASVAWTVKKGWTGLREPDVKQAKTPESNMNDIKARGERFMARVRAQREAGNA